MRAHLPKSARLLPLTLALVVVLALAGGAAFAVHLANDRGIGPFDRSQLGAPAIPVTLPGQVPAFTKADVRDYFALPPYVSGHHLLTPDGKPRIKSIIFMSREQAQAYTMLHDRLNELPAGALVCVVQVNGPLFLVGLGGPGPLVGPGGEGLLVFPGTPAPTPTPTVVITSEAYMIFDASTGNLITYGF
jgi:hypothetical protein